MRQDETKMQDELRPEYELRTLQVRKVGAERTQLKNKKARGMDIHRAFVLGSTKQKPKMSNYRNFKDYHIEQLRNLKDAKIYLSVALEDYEQNGDLEAFLLAVRDVILTLSK